MRPASVYILVFAFICLQILVSKQILNTYIAGHSWMFFFYLQLSNSHLELLCQNRLCPFLMASILIRAPVQAEEKLPHSVRLPPRCFTMGMVFFWVISSCFWAKHIFTYCAVALVCCKCVGQQEMRNWEVGYSKGHFI